MKRLFVLLMGILYQSPLYCQDMYTDVMSLQKLLIPVGASTYLFDQSNQQEQEKWATILAKYSDPSTSISPAAILSKYCSNPYFRSFFNCGGSLSTSNFQSKELSLASLGGMDVTNFADGIASFLVQRAKQELTVTFFDNFKKTFDKFPEFRTLFPNTFRTFSVIESFQISGYLNALREAFIKDVDNLHNRIPELGSLIVADCSGDSACIARISSYSAFFTSDPGYFTNTLLTLVEELKQGSNPAEILSMISDNASFNSLSNPTYFDLKSTMQLTNFISQSLLSDEEGKVWVSGRDIRNMLTNPVTFRIYVGLLYQSNESNLITFNTVGGTRTFRQILSTVATAAINPMEGYIRSVINDLDRVNSAVNNLRNLRRSGATPNHSDYYSFYSGIVSVIASLTDVGGFPISIRNQAEIDRFITLAQSAGGVYQDFVSRNYSAAVLDIRVFLEDVGIGNPEFLGKFFKYGSFMATVAQAQNGEQVQQAIESIALPAGSASIKRKSDWNIALNAYLGGYYAKEELSNTPDAVKVDNPSWGITAPIGIAFSKGLNCCKGDQGSLSLFLSVIDVGAISSFRFQNPINTMTEVQADDPTTMDDETVMLSETVDVQHLPETTLKNILAPGVYLIYGIPTWPVSIGIGAQRGPQLREIRINQQLIDADGIVTQGLENVIESDGWRYGFTLAVDIPIINFYTKSR